MRLPRFGGAGVSEDNKTFIKRFENMINNRSRDKGYECINAGIPALKSKQLIRYYYYYSTKIEPDIIIIGLSNNDISSKELYDNLQTFALLNKINNISTIFILEPNSYTSIGLSVNHNQMIEISKNQKIKVIDMHNYLLDRYKDGFLWWDYVHLTDYGNRLFAEKLYKELKDFI